MRLGNMRVEQQQRYLEDIAAEEERVYALGAFSATSVACFRSRCTPARFRVLSFPARAGISEHVFGIDQYGYEAGRERSAPGLSDDS